MTRRKVLRKLKDRLLGHTVHRVQTQDPSRNSHAGPGRDQPLETAISPVTTSGLFTEDSLYTEALLIAGESTQSPPRKSYAEPQRYQLFETIITPATPTEELTESSFFVKTLPITEESTQNSSRKGYAESQTNQLSGTTPTPATRTEELEERNLSVKALRVAKEGTTVETSPDDLVIGLCERCKIDDLEGVFDGKYDTPEAHFEPEFYYQPDSFRNDCYLCIQFTSLLKDILSRTPARQAGTEPDSISDPLHISVLNRTVEGSTDPVPEWVISLRCLGSQSELQLAKITRISTSDTGLIKGFEPKYQTSSAYGFGATRSAQYGSIKEWLRDCESHHLGSCCRQTSKSAMVSITVIDCRTSTLCKIRLGLPYIALSYLWGSNSLYEPPVQGRLPRELPKTIGDAMTVTLALGIHYLWIDRYCIDQTDSQEKARIIRHMDQVYKDAYLTIVSAAGESPAHGLPGVGVTARESLGEGHIVVGPFTFLQEYRVVGAIKGSLWNTRGWTYQEGLLSRRRLVFTDTEIYFQCLDMVRLEFGSVPQLETTGIFPQNGIGRNAICIYERISEYSNKQLSHDSDRLHAMQGIFTAFEKVEMTWGNQTVGIFNTHFWGIPIFSNTHTSKRLIRFSGTSGILFRVFPRSSTKYSGSFPTWSWAGRDAYVRFQEEHHERSGCAIPEWSTSSLSVTHISGAVVDMCSFTQISRDYKNFLPQLLVNSWSVWATVNTYSSEVSPKFDTLLGLNSIRRHSPRCVLGEMLLKGIDEVYFDYADDWSKKKLLLVYIQAYMGDIIVDETIGPEFDKRAKPYCLLLESVSPDAFRRIGIWRATTDVLWDSMGVDDFFAGKGRPTAAGADERWEKRTVRIV